MGLQRQRTIILTILALGLAACNNNAGKTTKQDQPLFDCNSLSDKKQIYDIAKSIIEKHDNNQIWNLSEIDTANFFTTEDYFTNHSTKNRLVLVDGSAGMSAGTAHNLLILFSCSDTFHVVWAGQVGEFTQTDIADLNGDGIKEITISNSMMWMGECDDSYNIFNFKNGKQNFLYQAHSTSFVDCGGDNLANPFKQGDTVQNIFDCSLQKDNNIEYKVKQIHTIRIYNGGQTGEEILKNATLISDTTNIKLK